MATQKTHYVGDTCHGRHFTCDHCKREANPERGPENVMYLECKTYVCEDCTTLHMRACHTCRINRVKERREHGE